VLRDGHFIEGCYAAKTFNSIDECVARLRKRHGDDDQIPDADLRRVIAGRYRQRQLTLLGKFGGLTNGVLERWWGRQHVKQKLTVPDTSGEGSGRGAVRLPGQADEEGGVSVQIGGADEDAALYERQECFQAKLRQFTPEQQAVIRGLLNRLDQGEDRDAAVADVAADHGLSQDAAWTLFEAYGRAIQECLGGS